MEVIPAIDLQDGRCVRLARGDFTTATIYAADPLAQAKQFAESGAAWLHVVDLDGARDGMCRQFDLIAKIARATSLRLQVGGGIRDASAIAALIDCGAERIVVGSLAATNPPLVRAWLARFTPRRIALAFDVRPDELRKAQVLVRGWQEPSGKSLEDALTAYEDGGLQTILCTDVGRDGMLMGPNLELYREVCERRPHLEVQASGGVSTLDDLFQLANTGVHAAIVGKALYEGRIELGSALREMAGAR